MCSILAGRIFHTGVSTCSSVKRVHVYCNDELACIHVFRTVSSRNWTEVGVQFSTISQKVRLSLELNEDSVSEAVQFYIDYKTMHLAERTRLDEGTV
ncbi:hypothetical protein M441DRAFT_228282 [Trichoderma asperellum CBS 433.97]|uniref:Uncharacterized protein n=1 Tax=Trichoderma asperellum (strain ATCC 204424 / CBS 433.97 / NBRC 101777) TaxID=1042311 RepID=A0A2T3ZQA2_TRIA4|nr:hypothetical protein M441DRAFT_228282 [Trichoderma asperellum CBS 433.97]PTB46976.1 hypothetical protein M441DRAFT_228282 [Trichoderma asperellum CBS 433.97]